MKWEIIIFLFGIWVDWIMKRRQTEWRKKRINNIPFLWRNHWMHLEQQIFNAAGYQSISHQSTWNDWRLNLGFVCIRKNLFQLPNVKTLITIRPFVWTGGLADWCAMCNMILCKIFNNKLFTIECKINGFSLVNFSISTSKFRFGLIGWWMRTNGAEIYRLASVQFHKFFETVIKKNFYEIFMANDKYWIIININIHILCVHTVMTVYAIYAVR